MVDRRRLVARATRAFVDRTPIDWSALLSHAGRSPDRALFESLRALAAVRASTRGEPARAPGRMALIAARLVVGLASVELALVFVVLGIAFARDETLTGHSAQLVIALAFTAASVPLAMASRREPRSLFLLAAFASAACAFARSALAGLPGAWAASSSHALRGVWMEVFTPACLWQFALDFPRVQRFTAFDRFARRAVVCAWALAIALFGVNLLTAYDAIDPGPFAVLLHDHPSRVFSQLFALALLPPLVVIALRSWRAPAAERRKVARLAYAQLAGTTPFLLSGVAWALLPSVGARLPRLDHFAATWLDRVTLAALAAMPLLTTAAVIVDEPLESRSVFRHELPSLVTEGVLRAVRLALVVALFIALYAFRHAQENGDPWSASIALLLTATVGLVVAAHPGWIGAIERHVFRRAADRDERLAGALDRIRLARGAREVLAVAARELRDTLGAGAVRILVAAPDGAYRDSLREAIGLPAGTALAPILRDATRPVDLSADGPLRALLPPIDRDWVRAHEIELAAPLERRDGSIGALVLLGRKDGGFPFDRRDRWLLSSLTTAVAAAWDQHHLERGADDGVDDSGRASDDGELAFQCDRCGVVSGSPLLRCACDGEPTLAALPHRLAGKFVVARRLGAGGMGVVYLARDVHLGRDVALKTFATLRAGAVARMQAEARAMASLGHDALATIYGLEIWRGTPILVVEYLPNGTLAHAITRRPLSVADTIHLGIRLARALAYIHAHGVLHRDLKPSNIGFTRTGDAKLLDFGLAIVRPMGAGDVTDSDGLDEDDRLAGTPAYLPPEAYRGEPPTPAFDLWALSVTLFEALTGVNPFSASDRAATAKRVATVEVGELCRRRMPSEPALCNYFQRALARRPEDRPRTAGEMVTMLEKLLSRTLEQPTL
jgi:hypothetical protein